ncbi:MAG: aminodeoxychorismate synthase component I [Microscillaceae bacterium]|jgi:para-aminobenzoate synthetase component 1|nr:aminodeoxychorismate synthase component I [Microscillaceae bacterium]
MPNDALGNALELMNEYGKKRIPFLFIIDFLQQNPLILRKEEINPEEILFQCNAVNNLLPNTQLTDNQGVTKKTILNKQAPIFADYQKAFAWVQQNLAWGNSYLLNLSAPTQVQTNRSLPEIFLLSQAKYKLWLRDKFVCFSPEIFVQIQQGQIATYPMKGTIDATIPDAETLILNDPKESAEHHTIVDLLRNDLSQISKNVRVERFRYLDKVQTHDKALWQVSSKIVGELGEQYPARLGDIMGKLLPAGSISGAPKRKTVEIILTAEQYFRMGNQPYQRGYYTGVFGYFDGENLDSGVMIRFIEQIDQQLFFKSGGGITFMSDAQTEYQELIDKVYLPIF